ncbi:MAG: hypothetical protein CMJ83_19750 [Planctomycetes bacterium]|nr:hypothetical protein [Planctomycetota bacterium]
MARTLRLLLLASLLGAPVSAQPTPPVITVTSAFDGGAGPFVRTEMVRIDITGVEPLRPITLFAGNPAFSPISIPGFDGQLQIDPAALAPFGPYDGIGIFGGSFPFRANSAGMASLVIRVPMNFGAPAMLPASLSIQAVVAQNPFSSLVGNGFLFSDLAAVTVDEPATQPSVATLSTQFVLENATPTIVISGAGFLPESTVQPRVTFISTTSPGAEADADDVLVIDEDPGPGITPALQVRCPPILGMPMTPPMTSAGPTLIRISYVNSGLYNASSANAEFTTAPTGFADPTFFVYQTALMPTFASISPKANLTPGGCTGTVMGTDFLEGATVFFDFGGASETAATMPIVVSTTQITVDPPALPVGLVGVVVRNVDHFPASPRETVLAAPATDFAYFDPSLLSSITVTGVTPPSLVEGTGGAMITVTGTCPQVGGYTALDLLSGPAVVNLGSNLSGTDAFVPVTVMSQTTPTPGQFSIDIMAPNLPPGLNPPGVTTGGLGNAGIKYCQIVPPICLNPMGDPHLTFAAIPGAEPMNALAFLAPFQPTITSITPNNAGRVDGGQSVTITGTGFFTNDTALPSSNAALTVSLGFGGAITETLLTSLTIVSDTQIDAVTPDLTALMLALPLQVDTIARNPDGQTNPAAASDDFWIVDSLSPAVLAGFITTPGTTLLQTRAIGGMTPDIFTFNTDVTLDLGLLVQAFGDAPLIIRCRGNLTLDGTVDLSGDVFVGAPGGPMMPSDGDPPSGGGIKGVGGDVDLIQGGTVGLEGVGPYDPIGMARLNTFGRAGLHNPNQAGGGGGGGHSMAGIMGLGMDGGPTGGAGGFMLAPGFAMVQIPVLNAMDETEFFFPLGGSGGAAGGLGVAPPYLPGPPAAALGLSGSGGNGGGGICIACDGILTVSMTGVVDADGQDGSPGALDMNTSTLPGGGGGGGSGGGILLQAIQGIVVNGTAQARSGLAGAGALVGVNDGGGGSPGQIRFAMPVQALGTPQIGGSAVVDPVADMTGY